MKGRVPVASPGPAPSPPTCTRMGATNTPDTEPTTKPSRSPRSTRTARIAATLAVGLALAALTPATQAGSSAQRFPDDPKFDEQWALHNTGQTVNGTTGTPDADVDAPEAWHHTTGTTEVVVGVIDTGVAYDSVDLAGNMWTNPQGVGGCDPGTHGYNFVDRNCDPDDTSSHGTAVTAVLGAVGDNDTRGTGLAWTTRIMALRINHVPVFTNFMSRSRAIEAIEWAIETREAGVNVRVLNASFGGTTHSAAFRDAIRQAGEAGILFVTASGNDSRDIDGGDPTYPCAYDVATLICAGGSGQNDQYAFNWGTESVDLAAPAGNVYAAGHNCTGTSCAAPFVAATAALIWGQQPGLTPEQVKAKILHNVDVIPSHSGKTVTGGRLNAYRALTGPIPRDPPSSTTSTTAPSGGGGSTPTTAPGSPPNGGSGGSGSEGSGGSGGSGSEGSGGGGGSDPGVGGPSDGSGPSGSTGSGDSATGDSATGDGGRTRGDGPSGTGTAAPDDDDDGSSTDSDADASGATPPGGRGDAVARYADDGGGRGGWWLVGGGGVALAGAALLTRRRWLPLLPFG